MTDDRDDRDDGGYVHDPAATIDGSASTSDDAPGFGDGPTTSRPAPEDREFGRSGWVLVGVVVLSFLVIPGAILYVPSTQGLSFLGFPYIHTLVALPMLPALLLGLVGVWLTTRA